jgi:copper(I)-binding protein/uncharacterized protein YcnI
MIRYRLASAAAFGCAVFAAGPASAHVTLERPQAAVGSTYKAVFRVPHGCDGAATTRISVHIPDGVIGVKPQPKPGWQLAITKIRYPHPVPYMHGMTLSEGVSEVSWTGRLPDDNYDEFVLSTFLGSALVPGTTVYFPVVQDCETGTERWTAIPGAGPAPAGAERAPGLKLLAAASGGMDHSMAGMSMGSMAMAPAAGAAAPAGTAVTVGDLAITRPWSRATPGGATTAAGYLTITNRGTTPDRLVSVSTPAAAKAELHQMTTKDGVMVMRPLSGGLALAPGQAVTLGPEGIHLMMTGLKAPLNKGDTLPVTLVFEKAGKVEVALPVQGVGAPGPDGAGDAHAGHKM